MLRGEKRNLTARCLMQLTSRHGAVELVENLGPILENDCEDFVRHATVTHAVRIENDDLCVFFCRSSNCGAFLCLKCCLHKISPVPVPYDQFGE